MIICAAIKDTRTGAVFGGIRHGFTHLPENKYQTRYEVTISDEVNFNEFNSKYEIVTQKGLIYTIIEKTDKG